MITVTNGGGPLIIYAQASVNNGLGGAPGAITAYGQGGDGGTGAPGGSGGGGGGHGAGGGGPGGAGPAGTDGTNAVAGATGIAGNTGDASAFTAARSSGTGGINGKTLTFTAFNGGTPVNVTFGDGTNGTVKTLDQLNTQLLANNLSATIDANGLLTITASNDYASSTLGSTAAGGSIGGTLTSALTFSTLTPALRADGTATYSLMRNIGSSIGISIVQTLLTRNTQVAHSDLAANVTLFNPAVQPMLSAGSRMDMAVLDVSITQQAAMIAYLNDFKLMFAATLLVIPLVLLIRPSRKAPDEAVAHAAMD